jgi:hypothetical protein
MSFSFDSFYEDNRRILIWLILIGFLWLLRDFFGLIFVTFVLTFIATPLIRIGRNRLKLPYRLSLVLVYILFLVALGSFFRYVTPSVIGEATRFLGNFSEVQQKLIELERDISSTYPGIERPVHGYVRSTLDEDNLRAIDKALDLYRQTLDFSDIDELDEEKDDDGDVTENARKKLKKYYDKEAELLVNSLLTKQIKSARNCPGLSITFIRPPARCCLRCYSVS